MNRHTFTAAVIVLMLAGNCPVARSAIEERLDGNLNCRLHVGLTDYVRAGSMLPIVLNFTNRGEERTIRVETGPDMRVLRRLRVAAGREIRHCLYVPIGEHSSVRYCQFYDAETNRSLKKVFFRRSLRRIYPSRTSPRGRPQRTLLGVSINTSGSYAVNPGMDAAYELKVDTSGPYALPDDWRGYTGVDLVIADHRLWETPEFAFGPLIDWMSMGGITFVVDASASEQRRIMAQIEDRAPFCDEHNWQFSGVKAAGVRAGAGGAVFVEEDWLAKSNSNLLRSIGLQPGLMDSRDEYGRTHSRRRRPRRSGEVRPRIEEVGNPPFWVVLLSLTAFSVVVGPLGWWYLVARKKQALLYYVAAPTLCAAVMAVVIVADMMHEGFRPYLSCRAVRFLDQRVKRSIDIAQFGLYVPFHSRGNLQGAPGELPHFFAFEHRDSDIRIEPTQNKCIYRGVLPPRQKRWFGRESIGRERRRLYVKEKGGQLVVENHLGCDLQNVVVAHGGKRVHFSELADGEKRAGESVSSLQGEGRGKFRDFSRSTILSNYGTLWRRWSDAYQRGNAYSAEVADRKGIQEHVWPRRWRNKGARALIFGIY